MNKTRGLMLQIQEEVLLILNYKPKNTPGFVKEIQEVSEKSI